MDETGIKKQAVRNPEIAEKSVLLGLKKKNKRRKIKKNPRIFLYFVAFEVQVVKFFLIIIKYYTFPECRIDPLSKSSNIKQGGCEYHILKKNAQQKTILLFFLTREHSKKLFTVTLIFQSEGISHLNSFVKHELVIKSTLNGHH